MIWNFDYTSIKDITSVLRKNGLSMSKKFGQNFLINDDSLNKIVDIAGIKEDTVVWEVGPGFGALTHKMLKKGAKVTSFEIDHGFCKILREQAFVNEKNFTLIEGDALKTWKPNFNENGTPDVICANLPYNVGSVLIASFIENRCLPSKMVFTLQSEVVQRICANNKDDEYSGFSILTSVDYNNKNALKLKAGNFFPAPNVDSAVVLMTKRDSSLVPEVLASNFFKVTRCLFAQRRKTVLNNLKALGLTSDYIKNVLKISDIKENARAEELEIENIVSLTKNINM